MRRRLSISTPCFFAETGNLFWEWCFLRGKRHSPTDNAVGRGPIEGCLTAHLARLLRLPGDVFQRQYSENHSFHQCCRRRIPFGSGRAFEDFPESGPGLYSDWTFRYCFHIGSAGALRRLFCKKGQILRKQGRPRWRQSASGKGKKRHFPLAP